MISSSQVSDKLSGGASTFVEQLRKEIRDNRHKSESNYYQLKRTNTMENVNSEKK